MDRQTFIHKAGGVFRSHKGWSWLTSREKRLHFWHLYQKHHPNSQTVYGQFPIHQLLHSKNHSIEHIIPCSVLKSKLKGSMFRGASLNPFNLMPSHQRLNQLRTHPTLTSMKTQSSTCHRCFPRDTNLTHSQALTQKRNGSSHLVQGAILHGPFST